MNSTPIRLGMDRRRDDAHLLERLGDANSDLAAVGYEDFLEQ